jgi:hypothetical protein
LDADAGGIQTKVADDILQTQKVWGINSCTIRKAKPLTSGAVGMMYVFDRSFDAPGGGSCPFLGVGQLHSSNSFFVERRGTRLIYCCNSSTRWSQFGACKRKSISYLTSATSSNFCDALPFTDVLTDVIDIFPPDFLAFNLSKGSGK